MRTSTTSQPTTASQPDAAHFADLLATVTTEPGILSTAYTAFHQYSLGNMLLAYAQCLEREIPLGPLATFPRWIELGRHVRKGEKAIALIQPLTRRPTETTDDEPEPRRYPVRAAPIVVHTGPNGRPAVRSPDAADLGPCARLAVLDITEIPFEGLDGNCQGRAQGRSIAISPIARLPWKTLFHECGHIALGHTAETTQTDDDRTPRNLREVEAESVAMLCCAALGLPGLSESRGYVQHWYGTGQPVPESSARKILAAADRLLRAGYPEPDTP